MKTVTITQSNPTSNTLKVRFGISTDVFIILKTKDIVNPEDYEILLDGTDSDMNICEVEAENIYPILDVCFEARSEGKTVLIEFLNAPSINFK